MSLKDTVTIVIPCKNEENYIGKTLSSILKQNDIEGVRIIIADDNSTDGTKEVIEFYQKKLNIEIIQGGTSTFARNEGAKLAVTKYILFMDADTVLIGDNLLSETVKEMSKSKLDLLTCKIVSLTNDYKSLIGFFIFNFINFIISTLSPFAVGMYFLTRRDEFYKRGCFKEECNHGEDYSLSRLYRPYKFKISNHYIGQDDKRFNKMGYLGMLKLLYNSYKNRYKKDFFGLDVG